MAGTLKEQYRAKRVRNLEERLLRIDRKVMRDLNRKAINEIMSDPRDRLIFEAFDRQQMAAAIDIVKKLKAINFGGLTSLAQARDAAVGDVTKVLAGNGGQGLIRKIVNLFKGQQENPLVDVLAFSDAMNNFFGQFTQYVTTLGGGDNDQTLSTIVTGKSPDELADINAVKGLGGAEKKKLGDLQKVIVNGFKPDGVLANIGKNWIDKYLKGRKGLQALAQDMLKMSVKDLVAISNSVTSSLKNVAAVGQAAAGAAQQGAVGTTASTGSTTAGSTEAGQGTKGSKSGAKAPGAQVAPGAAGAGGDLAKKVYDDIKSDFEGTDENTVMSILNTLAHNNKLKM